MAVHGIHEFDLWQASFAAASVSVYIASTNTLASVWTDEALSVSASNPQTLDTFTDTDGRTYGKFTVPLYTASPYWLSIDSTDTTGIVRPPLTTLAAEDASDALVTPTGGSVATAIDNIVARTVDVRDYGDFKATSESDDSASDNAATLTAAIGVASTDGGGFVEIPGGTYLVTTITLPANVILRGHGRGVTTLQSTSGSTVFTISGNAAGFHYMTLDGVSQVASSIGIVSKSRDELNFMDFEIKRFEKGIYCYGGRHHNWQDFYVDNCVDGLLLYGENDSGNGDELRHLSWVGGAVSNNTTTGLVLSYEDKKVWHNHFTDIGFDTNTGTALKINGARYTKFEDCWWVSNTTTLVVLDDTDTTVNTNTVVGLHFMRGSMDGGAATLDDTCQGVIFEKMEITNVDFTLTGLTNTILWLDCVEDSAVTLAGDTTMLTRRDSTALNAPGVSGTTTDATATEAWTHTLQPGNAAYLKATVVAQQKESEEYAIYHISQGVRRDGSELAYDAQTANFTLGDTVTGATSGATGLIAADADGGATGTLTLRQLNGIPFQDDEALSDVGGGAAVCNGTLSEQAPVLIGAILETDVDESNAAMACIFGVTATEAKVIVTGVAAETWEWIVHVQVTEIS
jgi:hypothetical protein